MICVSCKIDRLIYDFINNQKFCYHCVYRLKQSKIAEKRTQKPALCRMCKKQIIRLKNYKKRQRTVFCSQECAQKGHKKQLKNHWTRVCQNVDHRGEKNGIKNRSHAKYCRLYL